MKITFECFGITFRGDVDYVPEEPSNFAGHPDNWYPGQPDGSSISTLEAEYDLGHGVKEWRDANFLLDGCNEITGKLNDAAIAACANGEEE